MTEAKARPGKRTRRVVYGILLVALALTTSLAVQAWDTRRQSDVLPREPQDSLTPCGPSPNCVSSVNQGPRAIEPLIVPPQFKNADEAWQQLVSILERMPRARIVVDDGEYLRAEFQTPIFGFVDDVEFLLNMDESQIDVRSASRAGYSDLGTNRRRIEEIRRLWQQP